MNRFFIAAFFAVALCGGAAAEMLDVNGSFIEQGRFPRNWRQISSKWFQPLGTAKMVRAERAGGNAVQLCANSEKPVMVESSWLFPVRDGDIIELQAFMRGKGKGVLGIQFLDANKNWLANIPRNVVLSGEMKPYRVKLYVFNVKGKNKTDFIRVYFGAEPDSENIVQQLSAELRHHSK